MMDTRSAGNNVIRGLSIFIGDVKNCSTKDDEEKVVLKTLAMIRQKFLKGGLTSYDAKKYVWKLIYASILGYNVEFGHDVAVRLIRSSRFSEKSTGYIAMGIMLNEKSDALLFSNCMDAIKMDLTCGNEANESLALSTLGNMGIPDLAKELSPAVINKAFSDEKGCPDGVKKKACMCLLSFMRREKSIFDQQKWREGLGRLFRSTNYGLLLSASTLFLVTIQMHGAQGFEELLKPLLMILRNIKEYSQNYLYYMTPCPWLQVKIFKIFQQFPCPADPQMRQQILDQVTRIYQSTKITPYINKNNSDHSILFEAINLVLKYKEAADAQTRSETVKLLVKFIETKEPNIRYLGLECLSKLSPIFLQADQGLMTQHLQVFLSGLKEKDVSIRKRALDTIVCLCNAQVAGEVVNELLDHMQENDYDLMEDMVLKVAILAEKFALNLSWYIDVIIKLIEFGGDYVDDDLWFRVAQMVTGFGSAEVEADSTLQKYAAIKMFDVMKTPSLHEAMVKIGAFVLSEFGYLIHDEPNKSLVEQFTLIENKLFSCSPSGKAQLLTAFIKMTRHSQEVRPKARQIFEQHSDHWNIEIQQRACEYLQMLDHQKEDDALISGALEKMPNFSTEIQTNNVLTKRILALKIKDAKKLNVHAEDVSNKVMEDMKRFSQEPAQVEAALSDLVDFGSGATQNQPASMDNLLDLGSSPQAAKPQLMDLLGDPVAQVNPPSIDQMMPSSGGASSLLDLPSSENSQNTLKFKDAHPNSFAAESTVKAAQDDSRLSSAMCDNGVLWKALLPNSQSKVLFEDDQMEVLIHTQVLKYLVRCQLFFKCKTGGQWRDVQVTLSNQQSVEKNMQFMVSPVKYSSEEDPQVIVMAMLRASSPICPSIHVSVTGSSGVKQNDLKLPIYVNKIIEAVNMDSQAFENNWHQMTSVQPNTFQKLDAILDNPAPAHVPISAVLTQISNFIQGTLNMQVLSSENKVRAVGQALFTPASQTSFPGGPSDMQPSENAPLMIEAEFYSEDTSQFRLSIRAPPPRSPNNINEDIAVAILNVLKLFMFPNN